MVNIEIDQIRKAIKYSQKSAFNDSFKIVLIDNVELLNVNSANALLKIIEDSADTLGGKLNQESSGKYSDISITSFYGSHVISWEYQKTICKKYSKFKIYQLSKGNE